LYNNTACFFSVIPSEEGIQSKPLAQGLFWIPDFSGMTIGLTVLTLNAIVVELTPELWLLAPDFYLIRFDV